MPNINDSLPFTAQRFVETITFEPGGSAHVTVRAGFTTPQMGFVAVEPQTSSIIPNTVGHAGLQSSVADLLARNGLDPATATIRQAIRALVNEAINPV